MWLRLSLALLFFGSQNSFPGKNAKTMRERYGPPISESFLVRPGLVVSASYAKNGTMCELFIAPQKPTTLIKSADQTAKKIDSKLLTEVIDELVPEKDRGRGISADILNITCLPSNDCGGSGITSEKVTVYRNGGSNDEHYATIQWRSPECASLTSATSPPTKGTDQPFSLTIAAITPNIKAGADADMKIVLTNISYKDVGARGIFFDDGVDTSFQYDCRNASGESVVKQLSGIGSLGDVPAIKPGESSERTAPISRICDFSRPGQYQIQVSRMDVLDPKRPVVKSNEITITVEP